MIVVKFKIFFQKYKCIIYNEHGKVTKAILENDLYRLQNHSILKKTLTI